MRSGIAFASVTTAAPAAGDVVVAPTAAPAAAGDGWMFLNLPDVIVASRTSRRLPTIAPAAAGALISPRLPIVIAAVIPPRLGRFR